MGQSNSTKNYLEVRIGCAVLYVLLLRFETRNLPCLDTVRASLPKRRRVTPPWKGSRSRRGGRGKLPGPSGSKGGRRCKRLGTCVWAMLKLGDRCDRCARCRAQCLLVSDRIASGSSNRHDRRFGYSCAAEVGTAHRTLGAIERWGLDHLGPMHGQPSMRDHRLSSDRHQHTDAGVLLQR